MQTNLGTLMPCGLLPLRDGEVYLYSFEYARKLRGPDAQKPRAAQFIRYA